MFCESFLFTTFLSFHVKEMGGGGESEFFECTVTSKECTDISSPERKCKTGAGLLFPPPRVPHGAVDATLSNKSAYKVLY